MKLVDLLVKQLEEWPEDVTYFVQDGDREVKAGSGSKLSEPTDTGGWVRHLTLDNYNFYSCLCTDWKTSVVTKDVYTKHKTQMKRKVRKDFDATKEYSVDVSGCTEEEKKEVQQGFFDAGIQWPSKGKIYQYLDVMKYTNKYEAGGVTYHLLYGDTTKGCNMTAKEFLDLVYEPDKKGHIHAESMAMYAEDAKTTDEPWELWYIDFGSRGTRQLTNHPCWNPKLKYLRKQKTHIVHGVEIPDLRVSPELGDYYYLADPTTTELAEHYKFVMRAEKLWAERGLCYQNTEEGKQAAILHSQAMLGLA